MATCPTCDGDGVLKDSDGKDVECKTCGGTGEVDDAKKEPASD